MGGHVALAVWVVDSLVNVLPSTLPVPQPETTVRLEAARGEYASAQIAVRSASAGMLSVRVTAPALQSGSAHALELTANFEGFIPLRANSSSTPDSELVCK